MKQQNRRIFMLQIVAGTSVLASAELMAQEKKISTVRLAEDDKYAKTMGFRYDTNTVDQAKYPRHDAATQQCSKCQLYSGKEGDEVGPCSFFGGRLVHPGGWCKNFKAIKAKA